MSVQVLDICAAGNYFFRMDPAAIDILLVEDNPGDTRLVQLAVEAWRPPAKLTCAKNAQEALALLRGDGSRHAAYRPRLILLDLNLPGMDGRELLAEIKRNPELAVIPVVILTTSNAAADVHAALRLHANSYVVKPMNLQSYYDVFGAIESFWLKTSSLPS